MPSFSRTNEVGTSVAGLPPVKSVALAADLKRRGFVWVGPVTVCAMMLALGVDTSNYATSLAVVDAASRDEQLGLIQAHPELAGKEAAAGTLTQASTGEQRGAGLDQCSAAELARLRSLNARYRERFGFPFVVAVKGLSRYQIMDAVEARLTHDRATEFETCLAQIGRIARFRLDALLGA